MVEDKNLTNISIELEGVRKEIQLLMGKLQEMAVIVNQMGTAKRGGVTGCQIAGCTCATQRY